MRTWPKILERHSSDELLLGYADGELSRVREYRVRRHLNACWQCRDRYHEIEERVRLIARATTRRSYPGPDRIAAAREKLLDQARAADATLQAAPRIEISERRAPHSALAAAAMVLILAGAAVWWFGRTESIPSGPDLLAQIQSSEADLARRPLRQQFRVEVVESGASEVPTTSRLEIWSDVRGGRFASRWTTEDGVLRHALWRESDERLYVYDSAADSEVVRPVRRDAQEVYDRELLAAKLTPADVEQALMRWLQSRSWRPVSFSRDLVRFVSQDGLNLQIEAIPATADSAPAFRLTAHRQFSSRVVDVYVQVGARTHRPVSTTVRFSEAGRALELRVTAEHTAVLTRETADEVFSPEWVKASVFGSGLRFAGPESASRRRVAPSRMAASPMPVPVSRDDLLAVEMEVRYALHRAGACLGEPLQVVLRDGRHVEVTGLVDSDARKMQLLASLAQVAPTEQVRIRIETVDNAAADTNASESVTVISPSEPARITVGSPEQRPLEAELRRHYRALGMAPGAAEQEVTRMANRGIALAAPMLADAWALRRLAQAFGPEKTERLRPQTAWLLEVMLHNHNRALREHVSELRGLLEPALSGIAAGYRVPASSSLTGASSWRDGSEATFSSAIELHQRIVAVLTGSGHVAFGRPAETASGLLAGFSSVEAGSEELRETLARDFPGSPRLATGASARSTEGK